MTYKEIQARIKARIAGKSEEDKIREDEDILAANYLSEIERIQHSTGLTRKELATKIKISPSYLTQVFRGDKPLNFHTIAKMQRALKIRFTVSASLRNEKMVAMDFPKIKNIQQPLNVPQAQKEYDHDLYLIQGGKYYDGEMAVTA